MSRDEDDNQLLRRLEAARAEGQPWHQVGRILQQRFSGDPNWGRRREVIEAAARAARFAPVVIKRLVMLTNRLDAVAQASGIPAEDLLSPSYGAVELALRIYDRDRKKGLAALAELRAGTVTIGDLEERLKTLPAGAAAPSATARSAALRLRADRLRRCEAVVQALAAGLGKDVRVERRQAMPHFERLGFEAVGGGRMLAGFDVHLGGASGDGHDGLAGSLLLARLLPRFAVVFGPPEAGDAALEAATLARTFGMEWVGLCGVDDDGFVEVVQQMGENPEMPDPEGYRGLRRGAAEGGAGTRRTPRENAEDRVKEGGDDTAPPLLIQRKR